MVPFGVILPLLRIYELEGLSQDNKEHQQINKHP